MLQLAGQRQVSHDRSPWLRPVPLEGRSVWGDLRIGKLSRDIRKARLSRLGAPGRRGCTGPSAAGAARGRLPQGDQLALPTTPLLCVGQRKDLCCSLLMKGLGLFRALPLPLAGCPGILSLWPPETHYCPLDGTLCPWQPRARGKLSF